VTVVASKATRVFILPATSPSRTTASPNGPVATPSGYTFENLAPGNYRLDVLGDDNRTVVRSIAITVVAGRGTTVRVD
jgi:hypothetical protein